VDSQLERERAGLGGVRAMATVTILDADGETWI